MIENNKKIKSRENSAIKNNHFEIIVDESEQGEKKLRQKCLELKKLADKINKANELKMKENKIKDFEIDSLNNDITNLILSNYYLEKTIQKELELRNKYDLEQKKIASYCNDLKGKFYNMEKTIKEYENNIKNINKENIKLQEVYENKIEEIGKENKKLEKKIEEKINVHKQIKMQIIENEKKVESLKKDIEQKKNFFNEKEMVNKKKYQDLLNQYNSLQKKVYELQMIFDIKKTENKQKKINNKKEINELDIIEKKIKDYEKDNFTLTNKIEELSKQWREISMGSVSTYDFLTSNGNKYDKRSYSRLSLSNNKKKK